MPAATMGPRATDRSESPKATEKATDVSHAARLARFFERLAAAGFYGKVAVSLQNGKVCDVKIEQTKKVDEL